MDHRYKQEELKEILLNPFSEYEVLSPGRSLIEFNYYDSSGCFPTYQGCLYDERYLNGWNYEDKLALKEIIDTRRSLNKVVWWSNVEPSYLESHAAGVSYLEGRELLFYLFSWMFHALGEDPVCVMNSGYRFLIKINRYLKERTLRDLELTPNQKEALTSAIEFTCRIEKDVIWIPGTGCSMPR